VALSATPILDVDITHKSVPAPGGSRTVIEGLDFTLAAEEIVALVGPSGSGKTTLLRLVAGLDTQFTGRIRWRQSPGTARPKIGTVFQEPRLLPWRTVQQNIDLVRPPDAAVATQLLEVLGLTPHRHLYPPALSLGMARRVAIARAFAVLPEILLLDEPFVSLDPALAEQGRAVLVNAWTARRCAALLVTHDLAEAASLADRILLLSASPARVVRVLTVPLASRRQGLAEGARIAQTLASQGAFVI
jgi:ABC-type nitrate/sulfonate/bicarbonate transport system ATPase subunit